MVGLQGVERQECALRTFEVAIFEGQHPCLVVPLRGGLFVSFLVGAAGLVEVPRLKAAWAMPLAAARR